MPPDHSLGTNALDAEAARIQASAWDTETLNAEYERGVSSVVRLLESGIPVSLAMSGGKDSTLCGILMMEGLRRFVRTHGAAATPPARVFSANTNVENPEIVRLQRDAKVNMSAMANQLGIDFDFIIASPTDYEDYMVRVLSGRALPVLPWTNGNCTDWLKLTPTSRAYGAFARQLESMHLAPPVTLTGVRNDESSRRANNMQKRGEDNASISLQHPDGTFTRIPNDGSSESLHALESSTGRATLALISHWPTGSVFVALERAGLPPDHPRALPSYQKDFSDLLDFYGASSSGQCMTVTDPQAQARVTSGCSARSGCYVCLKVGESDKGAEQLANYEQYSYYRPLNHFRNVLGVWTCKLEHRNWMGRTINKALGALEVFPNSLNPQACDQLLRMFLTVGAREQQRAETRRQLITEKANDPAAKAQREKLRAAGVPIEIEFQDKAPHLSEPQFETLNLRQILVLTATTARENFGPPLWPIRAWIDVMVKGKFTDMPVVDTADIKPVAIPPKRYIPIEQNVFDFAWGFRDPIQCMVGFDDDGYIQTDGHLIEAGDPTAVAFWLRDELPGLLKDPRLGNGQLLIKMARWGAVGLSERMQAFCDAKLKQLALMESQGIPSTLSQAEAQKYPLEITPQPWMKVVDENASPLARYQRAYRHLFDQSLRVSAGLKVNEHGYRSAERSAAILRRRVPADQVQALHDAYAAGVEALESAVAGQSGADVESVAIEHLGETALFHARKINFETLWAMKPLDLTPPGTRPEQADLFELSL